MTRARSSLLAVAATGLLGFGLLTGACDDGVSTSFDNITPSTPTPTRTVAPLQTQTAAAGAKNGVTTTHITKISPGNGAKVTQKSTRSPNPERPGGICFEANWADLPAQLQWFQMAVDGELATLDITWVTSDKQATEGKGCYAPEEGLSVGHHQVAVSVQDPNNPNAGPRELVPWEFDVTN